MPPIGLLMAGMQFSDLFIDLSGKGYVTLAAAKEASAPVLAYGSFLQTIIDFLIVAFVIFLIVRLINRLHKPGPAPAAPAAKECPYCISAIPVKATRCPNCTSEL